jgi:hypothetical protein
MRRCKFVFDDSPPFEGWSLGSTWNGFDNVAVTRKTLLQITHWFAATAPEAALHNVLEGNKDMLAIEPMENGLIPLSHGYATQIVEMVVDD